jgi:hypothetical protein
LAAIPDITRSNNMKAGRVLAIAAISTILVLILCFLLGGQIIFVQDFGVVLIFCVTATAVVSLINWAMTK